MLEAADQSAPRPARQRWLHCGPQPAPRDDPRAPWWTGDFESGSKEQALTLGAISWI